MKKPGPTRTSPHIPNHIDASKLPPRVWFDKSGAGKWMIKYKDLATDKWRSKRLCDAKASLPQIWQAFDAQQQTEELTFKTLSREFQTTFIFKELAGSTQADYIDCHNHICNTSTNSGKFGDVPIRHWTTGTVRKYRDKRGETSKSRANKELAYIKRLFSWACEYEKVKTNPAKPVSKLTIKARQHYATDQDYNFLLQVAKESGYWYMAPMMEIAYLCRMRLSEVIDITDADETPDGLLIRRRKSSRNNIVEMTPRLKSSVDEAKRKRAAIWQARKQPSPLHADKRYLFISERTGDPLTASSIKTAKNRIDKLAKDKAERLGIEYHHFVFHDLKRKGISDTEGDKLKASGHRTPSMLNIYDVSVPIVKPAKDN